MIGEDHVSYTDRFRELSRLVPHPVTPVCKQIERYIQGLNPPIQGLVAAMQHNTLDGAITTVKILIDDVAVKVSPATDRRSKGRMNDQGNSDSGNKRARLRRGNEWSFPRCTRCALRHQKGVTCPNCFKCNRLGHLGMDVCY